MSITRPLEAPSTPGRRCHHTQPSRASPSSHAFRTGSGCSPSLVVEFLADTFPEPSLVIPATVARHIPARLSDIGIEGGAVWDALIAITAAAHDATLLTFDARAAAGIRTVWSRSRAARLTQPVRNQKAPPWRCTSASAGADQIGWTQRVELGKPRM